MGICMCLYFRKRQLSCLGAVFFNGKIRVGGSDGG